MIDSPLPTPSPSRAPGRDEVHVWRITLDQPAAVTHALRGILGAGEARRANHSASERARIRFVVARGALRVILGQYLGIAPADLRFAVNEHGKPTLPNRPGWPNLTFNVSHSGDLALIAVAQERAVGVDVERIAAGRTPMAIAARFFSPAEITALCSLPADQQIIGFFNCWTRKEAYLKARGKGLALPLDQFDVSLKPGEPAALLATRDDPSEASRWSLQTIEPGPGYVAALAVEGHGWQTCCWDGDAVLSREASGVTPT